jgi:hypothetical protein
MELSTIQGLSTCPYPDPGQSSQQSPSPHTIIPRYILIVFTSLCLGIPSSLSLAFPPINYICSSLSPICATCLTHAILLDMIILIILHYEYKSHSPSLCSSFHPSVTSSLFNSNILLTTLFSNNLSLLKFEEHCLLGCFHESISYRCLGLCTM